MGKLVIDVADVAHKPGAGKEINTSVPAEGLKGALGWVEDGDPVDLQLTAESVEEGIWVSGSVGGVLHLQCSRCLAQYQQEFEEQVDEIYYYSTSLAERNDSYAVHDGHIDLEPMIRDVVVLDIPFHPLHSEACKGLCTVCGADLNLEDCGHRPIALDPRWAPLASMLGEER